jgi:hypothetical protein
MATELVPLDSREKGRLAGYVKIVTDGQQTFIEVGNALAAIRNERLYRATHKTFEAFCKEKWGYNSSRARQLIAASTTAESVTTGNTLPNERVARELATVPEEKRDTVLEWAEEKAGDKPVTAAAIRAAAKEVAQAEPEDEIPEPDEPFKDGAGNLIPDNLADIFHQRTLFDEPISLIRKAKLRCRPLGEHPVGTFFSSEAAFERLSKAEKALREARPHAVCKECGGKGDPCSFCLGAGWTTKAQTGEEACTSNQEKVLKRRGIDPTGMTKAEASRRIDDIAMVEGWQPRPLDTPAPHKPIDWKAEAEKIDPAKESYW